LIVIDMIIGYMLPFTHSYIHRAETAAAVQYSTIQYSTVQYSTVQCGEYSCIEYSKDSAIEYCTIQYVLYSTALMHLCTV